jgi:hypothetical protein
LVNLEGTSCFSSLSALKYERKKEVDSIPEAGKLDIGALLSHIWSKPVSFSFCNAMSQVFKAFDEGLKFKPPLFSRDEKNSSSLPGERFLTGNGLTLVSFRIGVGSFFTGEPIVAAFS